MYSPEAERASSQYPGMQLEKLPYWFSFFRDKKGILQQHNVMKHFVFKWVHNSSLGCKLQLIAYAIWIIDQKPGILNAYSFRNNYI
jgi:hypothetical protein